MMATPFVNLAKSALINELGQLHDSVKALVEPLSQSELWAKPIEPGNSIGHLLLHLTGNLNHFAGGQLGHTGYVRDREREFSEAKPPSKKETLANLDAAVATFARVLDGLTEEQLLAPHPETRFGPIFQALVHLVGHFAIHRGQMSYIVRSRGN
jgi:uncharacterized damage-inducible protein DinB